MNMHSLLAMKGAADLTPKTLEEHFDGNICRCTGYRSILASFKTLLGNPGASPACCGSHSGSSGGSEAVVAESAAAVVGKTFSGADGTVWVEPTTLAELAAAIQHAKRGDASGAGGDRPTAFRIVAGNTGHGVYPDDAATLFISVAKVAELHTTNGGTGGGAITAGAAVSINKLIDLLEQSHAAQIAAGVSGMTAPQVLAAHLRKVANNQVRNVASWAGI